MKLTITDYNGYETPKLGVYFYGERILFGWEKDLGVRSYKFQLALAPPHWSYDYLNPNFEPMTFVETLDLKNLPLLHHTWPQIDESDHVHTYVDWETFVEERQPGLLKYCTQRLRRKLSKKPAPQPQIYDGNFRDGNPNEFLTFTKDTACSWAPPFTMGSKQGCVAQIWNREATAMPRRRLNDIHPVTQFGYWDLPRHLQDKTSDLEIFHMTGEQREAWFSNQTGEDQVLILKGYLKSQTELVIDEHLPWPLRLFGNDDTSWGKFFSTEEAAKAELEALRRMQPLDYVRDIMNGGWHFTN